MESEFRGLQGCYVQRGGGPGADRGQGEQAESDGRHAEDWPDPCQGIYIYVIPAPCVCLSVCLPHAKDGPDPGQGICILVRCVCAIYERPE